MQWYFVILLFIGSCITLSWLSGSLIHSLEGVARYLRWREFIIAFFVMAFAASLPNLFIDINAAFQGKPQLAFGDVIGGNLVDLTVVLAIAAFFSKKGLSAQSDMVQKSALFTALIAVLPLLLVVDGVLGRVDGIILIAAFMLYAGWLFSKKEHFKKTYRSNKEKPIAGFKHFVANLVKIVVLLALLLAASEAVVLSAQFFSDQLGISLALVGILIVGLGNAFPETYFSVISARKDENWLVLGDLMGSVIICATLVLGLIALIFPFTITDFSPFFNARIFLVIAALLSYLCIRTGRKITKIEGMYLLGIYIAFLIVEIFIQSSI